MVLSATLIAVLRFGNLSYAMPDLVSLEMTYNYVPTGEPSRILDLKVGVPVMIICNALPPHLVNGKIHVVKGVTGRLLFLSMTPGYGPSSKNFVVHRTDFQF